MNEPLERWKAIPGFEGYYEVSDFGRVRSLDRWVEQKRGRGYVRKGRILKVHPHPHTGHLLVKLKPNNVVAPCRVHVLVMRAFVGPPRRGLEVCHNNGIPDDNRLSNLRYGTTRENRLDAVIHGTHNMARKRHCKSGHPFDAINTINRRDGSRDCRTCRYERTRASRERRRVALGVGLR